MIQVHGACKQALRIAGLDPQEPCKALEDTSACQAREELEDATWSLAKAW